MVYMIFEFNYEVHDCKFIHYELAGSTQEALKNSSEENERVQELLNMHDPICSITELFDSTERDWCYGAYAIGTDNGCFGWMTTKEIPIKEAVAIPNLGNNSLIVIAQERFKKEVALLLNETYPSSLRDKILDCATWLNEWTLGFDKNQSRSNHSLTEIHLNLLTIAREMHDRDFWSSVPPIVPGDYWLVAKLPADEKRTLHLVKVYITGNDIVAYICEGVNLSSLPPSYSVENIDGHWQKIVVTLPAF